MKNTKEIPAFPQFDSINDPYSKTVGLFQVHPGMSLRDWFAGMIAAGALASEIHGVAERDYETFAIFCYKLADEMLAARKIVEQKEK